MILSKGVTQSPLYLSKGQKGHTRKDAMEVVCLGIQSLSPFSTAQSLLKNTKNNPEVRKICVWVNVTRNVSLALHPH